MEDYAMVLALRSLALTRPLLDKGPVRHLLRLLDAADAGIAFEAAGEYAASLLPFDGMLESYLHEFLATVPNVLVESALDGTEPPTAVTEQARTELALLSLACVLSPEAMGDWIRSRTGQMDWASSALSALKLPWWQSTSPDLFAWYEQMLSTVRREGFGVFRIAHMFTVHHSHLVPVPNADPVTLDQLQGYDWQRDLVLRNVRALLAGEPASDMLLYGDSGTGKSSTIKAAANALWQDGLRLIEVRPSQLHMIPRLLRELAGNPLKFILFIDDLSFTSEDDNFRALKGMLEGSVVCRPRNVIVCATSNRRRLIREAFSDRGQDDVHANETIQQQTALSDRFGLTVPFMDPGRKEYLRMVHAAAEELHLDVPAAQLDAGAERFAIEKGGRSGRAARQFADQVACGVIDLPAPPRTQ